jgi:hypothetical protein
MAECLVPTIRRTTKIRTTCGRVTWPNVVRESTQEGKGFSVGQRSPRQSRILRARMVLPFPKRVKDQGLELATQDRLGLLCRKQERDIEGIERVRRQHKVNRGPLRTKQGAYARSP